MTAQIIILANHRRKPEPRRVLLDQEPMPPPAHHPFVELWLAGLMTAAAIANTPLWPGGIDDLEV